MKIAIGYKMGSGKSIAVEYLRQKYGGNEVYFSMPIYDILHYAQGICRFEEEKDREFLQYIGTWARNKDPNVWINIALRNAKECKDCKNVFISDVRLKNEFSALKEDGWTCVKLMRKHLEGREGTGSINHPSETELDEIPDSKWDFVINNDGTLEDLYRNLDDVVRYSLV